MRREKTMSLSDQTVVHHVVQLFKTGMKQRAIARALHVSRNTVRRIIEEHDLIRQKEHSVLPPQRVSRRPSKLDQFQAKIDELLRQYPDITAQRVFEILRENGFAGGETIVRNLVRRIRPKLAPKPSYATAPLEPGEMAECDWSPYRVSFTNAPTANLQVFGYTLRYSTRKFYSFHESNGLHSLMDGHIQAFARFGAVAQSCKYDSQKPVILRWEGGQPIYNPRFIDFATYYEFRPEACRIRHPNDKPRVERSFYELTLSFFRGRSFRDISDLKVQLIHWLNTIADLRPIKRMRHRSRLELFAEELPKLRQLPSHPYDTARVMYKLCDIEGFINWQSNRYSLPYEYVTDLLPVRVTENERGPNLDQLRCAFAELGEPGPAFLAYLEQKEHRSAGYHARKILSLREGYNTTDLLNALSHALSYGAVDHSAIERILFARANRRRLDEYIAEATAQKFECAVTRSCTEPRDLAEYDALPCSGALTNNTGVIECPKSKNSSNAPPAGPVSELPNICSDSD
jgi:transposase